MMVASIGDGHGPVKITKLLLKFINRRVITSVFNCEFKIQAAIRTDKKVHSYDQKVKLSFNIRLEPKQLQWILNNKLPNDIYITNCFIVANDFHVRKKCVLNTYHYQINCGPYNVFQQRYIYQYNKPLRKINLQKIAKIFVGTYDFSNFSLLKDNETINRVRNIKSIKIKKHQDLVIIIIKVPSFIRHQVRMIVGSILACYEGKISLAQLQEKLLNPLTLKTKYQVSGVGLYLMNIKY